MLNSLRHISDMKKPVNVSTTMLTFIIYPVKYDINRKTVQIWTMLSHNISGTKPHPHGPIQENTGYGLELTDLECPLSTSIPFINLYSFGIRSYNFWYCRLAHGIVSHTTTVANLQKLIALTHIGEVPIF